MDIVIIVLLILLAIFLVVVEALLLPGVTVAAVGALAAVFYASYLAYVDYGFGIAMTVFGLALVLSLITLLLCLRRRNISKISLHVNSDSVVPNVRDNVKVGDKGISVTRLAPMGTIRVGEYSVEAKSVDGFINPKHNVTIIGFEDNIVLVEKIS